MKLDDPTAESPPIHLDQSESLAQLRLTIRDGQAEPTLYIHHSLADGHHQFSLVEELFSYYTDLVCTGNIRSGHRPPRARTVRGCARRTGHRQTERSGLERFMPAMFAYDLPPSRRATADVKPALPAACSDGAMPAHRRARHSDLIAFCRAHRLRFNAVLSAAILLAEWQLRDTPNIPVPYIYPVDLRYFLSPPVSATACTNPAGSGNLSRRDRPQHRCCGTRPRYRRDFSGRPVRRRDPAVPASLQPAICRESTGLARCRHV